MNRDEKEALYFKGLLIRLRKDTIVRVESEADVAFWQSILTINLPHLKFEFFPQSMQIGSGKNEVLLLKKYADKELLLCIDADYDYLLENTILNNPFVFHTYVYAIENIFSYAEGLKETLEKATNTEGVPFDFELFFKEYSNIIYDLLCYSLYSEKIKDGKLSRDNCGKMVGFLKLNNIKNDLTELKIKLEKEAETIKKQYGNLADFNLFLMQLNELGLTKNNAYLFVRGHDLFDNVTMKLMKFLGYNLLQIQFESLRQSGRENEIENLNKQLKTKHFERHLRQNQSFQSNSFYKNIVSDIQKAYN
jgi:uncharacterized protein YcgL (UPF0745 family)